MLRINERQIFYVVLIVGAGFFLSMAKAIPSSMGMPGDPGAGFFAFWSCVIIMVLLGYLLVTETFFQRADRDTPVRMTRHELVALAVTIAAIVIYLLLLSYAGFVISTLFFLFAFRQIIDRLIKHEPMSARSLIASGVFSVLATGFIYLVFSVLFELAMP
ncbi:MULTISPECIES: tripartite tricarboxylate transporter TctB family protein [Marinobacter]|uniref:tripartite tricarboxylate transporter TctB family protein n=1 Tax=Marinobacter TaxID=2742 RepID=UPI0013A689E5|nr:MULTISPECIES: tripartite tricarboxylate transporter TctB family protein [Marinobacter]